MKKMIVAMFVLGLVGVAGTVPASAQAYGGQPGVSCTNDTVTGDHFTPGTSPAIYVDGNVIAQAHISQDGTFSFTLPSSVGPGDHTVRVEGASERAVCTLPEVAGETVVKTPPGGTAFTGASIVTPSLIAIGLFVLGLATILAGRRRRRARAGTDEGTGNGPTS